jgi:hypothetical protein
MSASGKCHAGAINHQEIGHINVRPCVASHPPCRAKMQALCLPDHLNFTDMLGFACSYVHLILYRLCYPSDKFQQKLLIALGVTAQRK